MEKQSGEGSGSSLFTCVPLYLASVKNMGGLSIMHSSQSGEGGIKGGKEGCNQTESDTAMKRTARLFTGLQINIAWTSLSF